jgi:hypothetical protein
MNGRPKLGPMVVASLIVLFASQIAFAQVEWTLDLAEPVVQLGDPGEWDFATHRLGDIVYDGSLYHLYIMGAEGLNIFDSPQSVGHWTSTDVTGPWEEDPDNPVLGPEPGQWDGFTIYNIGVLYDGSMFHMWYGAAASQEGEVNVGYATSSNGSVWIKDPDNPVEDLGPGAPGKWNDAGMIPSTVLFDGERYRMWTTGVEWNGTNYGPFRIGYADSLDGITWDTLDDPVLNFEEPWEGDMIFFPEVVADGTGFAMWYGGKTSGFVPVGYAFSPDGIRWGKWYSNPVLIPQNPCVRLATLAVIIEGNTVFGWFHHCEEIYSGTSPLELIFFHGFESADTSAWSAVVP